MNEQPKQMGDVMVHKHHLEYDALSGYIAIFTCICNLKGVNCCKHVKKGVFKGREARMKKDSSKSLCSNWMGRPLGARGMAEHQGLRL